MRDSRMNAYGVKSKSHTVDLTSENCFLVENVGISLLSGLMITSENVLSYF